MKGEKAGAAQALPGAIAVFFLINLLFWGLAWKNAMGCIRMDFAEVSQNTNITVYYYTGAPENPFDAAHCADSLASVGKNTSVMLTGVDTKHYSKIRFDFTGQPGTKLSITKITMMTSPFFQYAVSGERLTDAFQAFNEVSAHSMDNGILTIEIGGKTATMEADHIDLQRQWNPVGILFVGFLEFLLFGLVWSVAQNYIEKDYVPYVQSKIPEKPVLDVAKFVCAFLIISIHVSPFADINANLNYFIAQILARIAVPSFFTISGYLFFSKLYDDKSKTFRRNDAVLKRYFCRVCGMYFIWNLFYLFVVKGQNVTVYQFLWSLLVQGGFWQLWYLWALSLAVFAMYHLLCRRIPLKHLLVLSAVLYIIGTVFDFGYQACIARIPSLNLCYLCYQAYLPRGGQSAVFFAVPFVCMGAFFAVPNVVEKVKYALLKALAAFFLMAVEGFIAWKHFNATGTSLWILLPAVTYYIFAWLLQQNSVELKNAKKLRAMSSLIYLIHTFFLSETVLPLGPPLFQDNKPLQYLFVSAASCVFAEAFLWASTKFSILKRLY